MKKIERGDVFRVGDYPFADAVVTYIDEFDGSVVLARPYIYSSETSRQPLMGFEVITASKELVTENYKLLDTGRSY